MQQNRAGSMISKRWVKQTRAYFLKFLRETKFSGLERHAARGEALHDPEWLIMLIGSASGRKQEKNVVGDSSPQHALRERAVGGQLNAPPISESQLRERCQNIHIPSHFVVTPRSLRDLAALAHPIGRTHLKAMATLVTPDTLMRRYRQLIARKFDGSQHRQRLGRPLMAEEIEQLTVQMTEENLRWDHRRIQGALANLGHRIDAITVRNILRRHHMEPAPQRHKAGMR